MPAIFAETHFGSEPQAGPAKTMLKLGRLSVRMGRGAASSFLLALLPGAAGLGMANTSTLSPLFARMAK